MQSMGQVQQQKEQPFNFYELWDRDIFIGGGGGEGPHLDPQFYRRK